MTRINLDQYGQCKSKTCPFNKTCAQHYTAGDFRSEDGFEPEILKKSDVFLCKTINESINEKIDYSNYPINYDNLRKGFRSLKQLQLLPNYE